jgi:hypothetical protein
VAAARSEQKHNRCKFHPFSNLLGCFLFLRKNVTTPELPDLLMPVSNQYIDP